MDPKGRMVRVGTFGRLQAAQSPQEETRGKWRFRRQNPNGRTGGKPREGSERSAEDKQAA